MIMKHVKEICPFDTCIKVITNPSTNSIIRASFLELFKNSYLQVHSIYSQKHTFPNNLKVIFEINNDNENKEGYNSSSSFPKMMKNDEGE